MNVFIKKLNKNKKRINKILLNQLKKNKKNKLFKVIKYSIFSGGKRIRPFIIYNVGKMLNLPIKILDNFATAIEYIHSYSLIHDDLPSMDNEIERRGKKSCHIKFGESYAILAGDALQALAFNILSDYKKNNINKKNQLKIIKEISDSIGLHGMCGGQALEIELNNKKTYTSTLKSVYMKKTGRLIKASIRICAYAANIKKNEIFKLLDNYADNFSLAFQISDDIIDISKDISTFENNKINKIKNNKITYPILIGIKNAKKKLLNLYEKSIKILNLLQKKYNLKNENLRKLMLFTINRKK